MIGIDGERLKSVAKPRNRFFSRLGAIALGEGGTGESGKNTGVGIETEQAKQADQQHCQELLRGFHDHDHCRTELRPIQEGKENADPFAGQMLGAGMLLSCEGPAIFGCRAV